MAALTGITVLDLTTLLPGPLATLLLAESGADVVKIERPPHGDEMRSYEPRFGSTSANFALLNRGKRSLALDLKDPAGRERLLELAAQADVLVEQFRPGVLDRLGIGFERLHAVNPRLVCCSITGYGQTGARRGRAGHDLNYVAEAGLLSLTEADGRPQLPSALLADIAGGAYPAVVNILLALLERERTGVGRRLDVPMAENVLTLLYWALGGGWAAGEWPRPGEELVTGGSPRYGLYRTADGRWLAVAPLEDRFWTAFCDLVGLPAAERDDRTDPHGTRERLAALLASRTAAEWEARFAGHDVCCSLVRSVAEAAADPELHARGVFAARVADGAGGTMPALPVPLDRGLRTAASLGELPFPPLDGESQGR